MDFGSNREKYVKKGRGLPFRTAVQEMDQYTSDPIVCIYTFSHHTFFFCFGFTHTFNYIIFILQKFCSLANITCSKETISVKTERDVELQLGIKIEPQQPSTSSVIGSKEKEGLIHQIDDLKGELQNVALSYRQLKSEHSSISNEKEKLKEELSAKESHIKQLQSEYNKKKEQDANSIENLTRENKTLKAQLKQLQSGISNHQSSEINKIKSTNDANSIDDKVYEIEAIIDHKGGKNSRQYLVRWKGYSSDDDTWEKESHFYPEILNKYKKMKNLT